MGATTEGHMTRRRKLLSEFKAQVALERLAAGVNLLRSNDSMAIVPGEAREVGSCDLEIAGRETEPCPDIRGILQEPMPIWTPHIPAAASPHGSMKGSLRPGT